MGELHHVCFTTVDFTMHSEASGHSLPHVENIVFYYLHRLIILK